MESNEQSTPPAVLTAIPPDGILTRPTAIIAPVDPKRSLSALFSSQLSAKEATDNGHRNLKLDSQLKSNEQQHTISSSLSSAFQPINSIQNILQKQSIIKSTPVLMDIPQHKALERGQQLHRVHISHPQSPSIVHVKFDL